MLEKSVFQASLNERLLFRLPEFIALCVIIYDRKMKNRKENSHSL